MSYAPIVTDEMLRDLRSSLAAHIEQCSTPTVALTVQDCTIMAHLGAVSGKYASDLEALMRMQSLVTPEIGLVPAAYVKPMVPAFRNGGVRRRLKNFRELQAIYNSVYRRRASKSPTQLAKQIWWFMLYIRPPTVRELLTLLRDPKTDLGDFLDESIHRGTSVFAQLAVLTMLTPEGVRKKYGTLRVEGKNNLLSFLMTTLAPEQFDAAFSLYYACAFHRKMARYERPIRAARALAMLNHDLYNSSIVQLLLMLMASLDESHISRTIELGRQLLQELCVPPAIIEDLLSLPECRRADREKGRMAFWHHNISIFSERHRVLQRDVDYINMLPTMFSYLNKNIVEEVMRYV